MKIVVLDGYTLNPGDLSWDSLKELGELTVYDRTSPEQVAERIVDAPYVFTNKTILSREVLSGAKHLQFIGVLATGYNIVDVKAAREMGIVVCNIPTYGTMAVAQFTIALLLELCHHVGLHNIAVHDGEWSAQDDFSFPKTPLVELSERTIGLIGFGRIGQQVAKIAAAFGMCVLVHDPVMDVSKAGIPVQTVTLDELLNRADVVSLHCPLTSDNEGMMNKERLSKMKPGAFLINTARGQLINESDLAEALAQKVISGAALDVVSTEPIQAGNPLYKAPNCILTPHIAWAAKAARERLMAIAVDNLKRFQDGNPRNIVN